MPTYMENSVATGLERSVFIPIPNKGNAKNAQTTSQLHSSHMSHMLVSNAQNSPSQNFQMFKLDLEKAEEPEIKLPTSVGSSRKQESSRKTSIFDLSIMPKAVTVCTQFPLLHRVKNRSSLPWSQWHLTFFGYSDSWPNEY